MTERTAEQLAKEYASAYVGVHYTCSAMPSELADALSALTKHDAVVAQLRAVAASATDAGQRLADALVSEKVLFDENTALRARVAELEAQAVTRREETDSCVKECVQCATVLNKTLERVAELEAKRAAHDEEEGHQAKIIWVLATWVNELVAPRSPSVLELAERYVSLILDNQIGKCSDTEVEEYRKSLSDMKR